MINTEFKPKLKPILNYGFSGVGSAAKEWMEFFEVKEAEESPDKIMIVQPDEVIPGDYYVNLAKIASSCNLPPDRYIVVTPLSDYRETRKFLSSGVVAIYGPQTIAWDVGPVQTWLILSSAIEIKAKYWLDFFVRYYSLNWPALMSPVELLVEKLNINHRDLTALGMSKLGVMPAKLMDLNDRFETIAAHWTLQDWLNYMKDIAEA